MHAIVGYGFTDRGIQSFGRSTLLRDELRMFVERHGAIIDTSEHILSELYKKNTNRHNRILHKNMRVLHLILLRDLIRLHVYDQFAFELDQLMILSELYRKGKEPNPMARFMAKTVTEMRLKRDDSDAHIAQMIIEGCQKGIEMLIDTMSRSLRFSRRCCIRAANLRYRFA